VNKKEGYDRGGLIKNKKKKKEGGGGGGGGSVLNNKMTNKMDIALEG